MKKKYLDLLAKEIETIKMASARSNYTTESRTPALEKLIIVHENLSGNEPSKHSADYRLWTNEPGIVLIHMTDPDYESKMEDLAIIYTSIMTAYAYWKVLYAIIFKEHL